MSLGPRDTVIASVGALAAWLAVLLGIVQIAYMRNAYSLLNQDIPLALGALVGFVGTMLFIFGRSRLSFIGRVVLATACLLAFPFLTFWGVLSIACAHGNCL